MAEGWGRTHKAPGAAFRVLYFCSDTDTVVLFLCFFDHGSSASADFYRADFMELFLLHVFTDGTFLHAIYG